MSLNHKRRIFRHSTEAAKASPPLGLILAVAGGSATLLIVAVLFVRAAGAPASTLPSVHLAAGADQLIVLDGDTLRVGAQIVRLAGIVALARGSMCHGAGHADLDCGSAAANALAALVRGRSVNCMVHGHDRQGRPLADCSAAGEPLSVALVQNGWAHADAVALRGPEAAARAAHLGVWHNGS